MVLFLSLLKELIFGCQHMATLVHTDISHLLVWHQTFMVPR